MEITEPKEQPQMQRDMLNQGSPNLDESHVASSRQAGTPGAQGDTIQPQAQQLQPGMQQQLLGHGSQPNVGLPAPGL